MGYLTTFTVYNDVSEFIRNELPQFAQKIYDHIGTNEATDFGIKNKNGGGSAWAVHVQQSRHADDHTIYVHMGNCVTEVNPCSNSFKSLLQNNPNFADDLITFIEKELKELKKIQKKMQK